MTRWMFPYILLISLVALAAAVLNLWKRFAVPAFAPVLLNISIILAALFLSPYFDPPVLALAAGVMIGGVLQLLWQVPSLVRIGMLPRIRLSFWHALKDPAVQRVMKNMAPTLLAVSVAQFSLIIDTQIASWLAPGSVSWVSYGDRLMEFPTSLLGIAMGVAIVLNLLIGATLGVVVPFTLNRLGRDPALGSSVLLTFSTDGLGFLIFLGLATMLF